ncbi:LCP family protein [Lacrimispora saccharolytica]|uniref:LCP family protein n=1 Tax=Lacrimispora saccharolytica TaxID=84030 RepID=UPI00265D1F67|nr:LCP family protein [Lacrimispora saccharolytica]MBS7330314.1 LCP family protein [Lachnospiraceae bacterium]MCF2656546.1 LCP family protein [Lacrimispora saccharolytica]MCI7558019.1 LCP family protein [Lachnospiraceae bacterium]MDY5000415.1 LCP family protein [Lachnospiraceae bacterium]
MANNARRNDGRRPRPDDGRRPRQGSGMSREEARRREAIRRKKAKKKKRKTILLLIEIVLLLVLIAGAWFISRGTGVTKINIKEEDIVMNETVANNEALKGYRNIALFGVDARDKSLGKGNRSDTIIIASINEDTGDVKLCSVYRDTYLNLGNDSYNKCNAAYAKGGPEQAINMLNMNLDLNITDYVTVGFTGLREVIDAIGGVTIDVQENEIVHLNNYQISMVGKTDDGENYYATEGKDYIAVTSPGPQVLNGLQATAYCRIRYVGDDFVRAERQRRVIAECLEVAKKSDPTKLIKAFDGVTDSISTSFDADEIASLIKDVGKYNIVASDGFPFATNRETGKVGSKGSCVIPNNLEQNVVLLQDFFFGNTSYEPSVEVKNYSSKISSDTGY